MGIWSTITGFFGGKTGERVMESVDKAVYTRQEATQDDAKDLTDARTVFASPSQFDSWVDKANRLIRPGVTLWLVGGMIGWWQLPKSDAVDPYWQNIFMIVLSFWFGGRALLKDLPAAIKLMRG
jgi:hypothetical protein